MYVVTGSALLVLALYVSILSYVLRTYSRGKLSERLSEDDERKWLGWLDEHETELQVGSSFLRFTLSIAFLLCFYGAWFQSEQHIPLDSWEVAWPALPALLLLMVLAIGVPNALALHAGEAILAFSLPFLKIMWVVCRPVSWTLLGVDFVVRRLLGKSDDNEQEHSERAEQDILDAVLEGEAFGAVDEEQKEMIESVIALHETTVSEIMTPRTDMVAIPADADITQVHETINRAGHSRIPVYDQSVDHIIGVLYAKDLIGLDPQAGFDVRGLLRTVPYVPETKNVDHLLRELKQSKVHIAIVLDEYGGTAGLVTFEDIIEELVGEIDDEYDPQAPPPMSRIDEDTLEVDARVHVEEINEELEVELPEDEDYDTIGGFVFSTLGRIPVTGDEFTHENLHFRVVSAEARKINRLRIHVQREVRQPA